MRLGISALSIQVIFLIVLQLASFTLLWLINPITQAATDTFALYLSLDLVAFAMLSYIYRSTKHGLDPAEGWMSLGYVSLVALLISNLVLA